MAHEFEVSEEIALDATPEQVWDAIATGPGVDSWFMGHSEIEPGEGGRSWLDMGGGAQLATITSWEPGKRFAYRSDENPDGTFMAFEYLLEARDGGSTVLRFVHSGFLGDDWAEQYDALRKGDRVYLEKLACYVRDFAGRYATYSMLLPGPKMADPDRMWASVGAALGLSGPARPGEPVRLSVPGIEAASGVVAFTRLPTALAVRTADGLYTFMHGYQDTPVVEYQGFAADVDGPAVESAWKSWLAASFG